MAWSNGVTMKGLVNCIRARGQQINRRHQAILMPASIADDLENYAKGEMAASRSSANGIVIS